MMIEAEEPGIELLTGCDPESGKNCVLPPPGPRHFYPYFTQARVGGVCVWEFGNMRNGNTFGGDQQYGQVGPTTLGASPAPSAPIPTADRGRQIDQVRRSMAFGVS